MKRVLSLLLALSTIMVLAIPTFADESCNWDDGTDVSYVGSKTVLDTYGDEQYTTIYTVVVPKLLDPGTSGDVTASGTWPENYILSVSADSYVDLEHSISAENSKQLSIEFNNIVLSGSNTGSVSQTEIVSVEDIGAGLFGVWSGHFDYDVQLNSPSSKYNPVFSDNTWEDIIEACQNRTVPSTWTIGSSKIMEVDGEDVNVVIVGKNHDTYSSGGTAPLTFATLTSIYNSAMNTEDSNSCLWENSIVRKDVVPQFKAGMPTSVQNALRAVDKSSLKYYSTAQVTTSDELFLFSEYELFGDILHTIAPEGEQYEYWKTPENRVAYDSEGNKVFYWCRSLESVKNRRFTMFNKNTLEVGVSYATTEIGTVFGFCF